MHALLVNLNLNTPNLHLKLTTKTTFAASTQLVFTLWLHLTQERRNFYHTASAFSFATQRTQVAAA